MKAVTERDIRASFINCPKGEFARLARLAGPWS
ncbi:FBP domain-containing protein [Streptomyces sp. WM6378]|nr:FBP domain-containing protein [Streptomyces sp. WM6378]